MDGVYVVCSHLLLLLSGKELIDQRKREMMRARSRVMTAKKGFSVQVISRRHNVSETGVTRACAHK